VRLCVQPLSTHSRSLWTRSLVVFHCSKFLPEVCSAFKRSILAFNAFKEENLAKKECLLRFAMRSMRSNPQKRCVQCVQILKRGKPQERRWYPVIRQVQGLQCVQSVQILAFKRGKPQTRERTSFSPKTMIHFQNSISYRNTILNGSTFQTPSTSVTQSSESAISAKSTETQRKARQNESYGTIQSTIEQPTWSLSKKQSLCDTHFPRFSEDTWNNTVIEAFFQALPQIPLRTI